MRKKFLASSLDRVFQTGWQTAGVQDQQEMSIEFADAMNKFFLGQEPSVLTVAVTARTMRFDLIGG